MTPPNTMSAVRTATDPGTASTSAWHSASISLPSAAFTMRQETASKGSASPHTLSK